MTTSGDDVRNVLRADGASPRWFVVARWDYGFVAEVDGSAQLDLRRVARGMYEAHEHSGVGVGYQDAVFFETRDDAEDEAAAHEALVMDRPQDEDPGPRSFAVRPADGAGPVVHVTLVPARGPRGPRLHARHGRVVGLEPGVLYPFEVVGSPAETWDDEAELVVRLTGSKEGESGAEVVRLRLLPPSRDRPERS